jgi:hypothetical protein
MSSSDAALDALLAKQELSELVAAYSRAVDRADEAALSALFHPGAISDSGVIRAPGHEFARLFVAWVHEHAAALSHCVCSSWFEMRGDDEAIGETYVLAFCRLNERHGGGRSLTAGRYLDRFALREGRWKFIERRFVVDDVLPAVASADSGERASATPRLGGFKPQDPIYEFWSARA